MSAAAMSTATQLTLIERLQDEGDTAARLAQLTRKREVLARWMAEACAVLFSIEEEAEDGGDSLRMLRERGLRLVRAVLQPAGPNVAIEPRR